MTYRGGKYIYNWYYQVPSQDDIEIKPSLIQPVKEIKSLGLFTVNLNLHSEIQSQIKIKVVPQEINE